MNINRDALIELQEKNLELTKNNQELNAQIDSFENFHLNTIIEGTTHSIWAFDRDYKILYLNKVFQNDFFNSFGVLLTKGSILIDALPDPLKMIWKSRYDRVLANEYFKFEDEVETPIGTIYIDVVVNPIIQNGKVVGGSCFGSDITASKRIENQLKDNNEFVKSLLNAIPAGIFFKDKEGKYLGCNYNFSELTGKKSSEIIGKSVFDVWPNEIAQTFYDKDNEIFNSGVSHNYETQIFDKNGIEKHVIVAKDVYKDLNGNTIGIVGAYLDISEQKIAQERLSITKDSYQSIFNSVSEAIYIMDANNVFIDVNVGSEKMYLYSREELIGKTPLDVSAEGRNNIEMVANIIQQVRETGMPQNFEFWGMRKNGEIFPKEVIINKGTYFGNDCIIATSRDITQRKKIELIQEIQYNIALYIHKAKSVEDLFQTVESEIKKLIPTSNFCVAIMDEKSKNLQPIVCDDVNIELYDWNLNQALSHEIINTGKSSFLKGDEIIHQSQKLQIQSSGVSPLCWIGVPILIKNNPEGVLVVQNFYDQNAYEYSYVTLLEMIAYEVGAYMERQLMLEEVIAAKVKAEESASLKTAFMQNLSHEIRTPLNGIIGFSELLKDKDIHANDAQKYSEIIIERGWQLTSIINDILTISSLETQQEQLFDESFNVNDLLKNQVAVFSEQAHSKGIRLVINKLLSEGESEIYTDKNKLGQILNNLFTNAFKFTQQGEIELGCTLSGNMLQFFVRDTGIGIEKSKQELIFERFAQADDLIRRDYGGTGLGLSICKGFVELMGGKIWIESEPNQGSTFHFMIPFLKNIINNVTKNMEQEINGTDKLITVLVAEDDEINFSYLKIVLKKLNVNVIRAENGQEAVDLCKTELIDIILMDIKMPVMNGYTAAKLIKEFKPNLPIIAQSAHAVQAEIEEYKDAFDDYITKPIKINDFKEILQKYFK